ncbi:MAG: hypothetical protein E7417_02210 [Ruminococcaceae bacterium]|nr:hypothetical protein [Oscillospiraceae bacterium]
MKKSISSILIICLVLSSFTFTAFAATETIITTDDTSKVTFVGTGWAESTNANVKGPLGGTSWSTTSKNDGIIFDASELSAGTYGVYVYMTPYGTTAEYMDVTVTAAGVGENYRVKGKDDTNNGDRHWRYLGTHTFAANSKPKVIQKFPDDYVAGSGCIRASGVKFVLNDTTTEQKYTSEGTIVSASSSNFSVSGVNDSGVSLWKQTSQASIRDPFLDKSWYAQDGRATAKFSASGLSSGKYGVYLYMTPYGPANDTDYIDVTVSASGSGTISKVNSLHGMTFSSDYKTYTTCRSWLYLGNYTFNGTAGEGVLLAYNAKSSKGSIRASAVRFVPNDTKTNADIEYPVTGHIISADSSLHSMSTAWSASSLKNPLGGGSYFTGNTSYTATYKASGLNGNYGVYAYALQSSSMADLMDATITASGTSSAITANTVSSDGNPVWVYLGRYDFNGSSSDKVVIKKNNSATGSYVYSSAIKFVKDDPRTDRPGVNPIVEKITLANGESIILDTEYWGFNLYGTNWSDSSIKVSDAGSYFTTTTDEHYARWYFDIGAVSGVEVFIPKLSSATSGSESNSTTYTVYTNGKTTKKVFDMTTDDCGWYSLGKYDFVGGGNEYIQVQRSAGSSGVARAIAVKLSLNEVPEPDVADSILAGTESLHIFERMGMYGSTTVTASLLDREMTRATMAAYLTRLFGKVDDIRLEGNTDNYADVSDDHWAKNTLAYIKAHPEFGIKKHGSNSFSPDSIATKTDLLKFILNQLGYYEGVDYSAKDAKNLVSQLGITVSGSENLTPRTMSQILYSAFEVPTKNDSSCTFFEKMVRENSGIKDANLLNRDIMTSEMKALRTTAKNKDRNVIYNNDGNDVYSVYDEYPGDYPVTTYDKYNASAEKFLKPRTTGIADTQVNTVYYCTGVVNSYTHESSGETDTRKRDWSYLLKDFTGKDTLDTMIDYCRDLDIDVFWSMRMNDTHDYIYDVEYLDTWKQANLDKLFADQSDSLFMPYGQRRWTSIDYSYQESRQKIYDILEDTISRYDIDGLELDFTRWPIYFKEVSQGYSVYPENIERMNNLMRMVRVLTEKYSMERGKPILISIYVPDSMDFCKAQGLDIEKWLDEDLFDIAAICSHVGAFKSWEDGIAEYKGKVPVYAAVDNLFYSDSGLDVYTIDVNEAALAYEAGAKGIYTYNYFYIDADRFDVLGDPATVKATGLVDSSYTNQRLPYKGAFGKDTEKFVTLN